MFNVGPMEMLVIFVVALLVFGPKKLPELGKSLGKGLAEFRRASAELRGSLEREMENIEHEVKVQEQAKQSPTPAATIPAETTTVPTQPELHAGVTPEEAALHGAAPPSAHDQ